jgi:hypothetical protein
LTVSNSGRVEEQAALCVADRSDNGADDERGTTSTPERIEI